jgi:hypothetical protein
MSESLVPPALIPILVVIIGSLAAARIGPPTPGTWPFIRTNKQRRQT